MVTLRNVVIIFQFLCLVVCFPSFLHGQERSTKHLGKNKLRNQLSSSNKHTRKKAIEAIEEAGWKGYRFLKKLSGTTSKLVLNVPHPEAVKKGETFEWNVTFQNVGNNIQWINENWNIRSSMKDSYPFYENYHIKVTLPSSKKEGFNIRIGTGDGIKGNWGGGRGGDVKLGPTTQTLWQQFQYFRILKPDERISATFNFKADRKPFYIQPVQFTYSSGHVEYAGDLRKIKIPETWKGIENTTEEMKSFNIKSWNKQLKKETRYIVLPKKKTTPEHKFSYHPDSNQVKQTTEKISGTLRLTNRNQKSLHAWNFDHSTIRPFSYLIVDAGNNHVVQHGSLDKKQLYEEKIEKTFDEKNLLDVLKQGSGKMNFQQIKPGRSIETNISIPAPSTPGKYNIYMIYGDFDIRVMNKNHETNESFDEEHEIIEGIVYSKPVSIEVTE